MNDYNDLDPLNSKDEVDLALDFILDEAILQARESFYVFVQLMATELLPDGFVDGRHIDLICNQLQQVEESVANPQKSPKRLQIFLPPGAMKSKLGNLFCAWALGRHPNWSFMVLAANEELATSNYGRPVRDLLSTPKYQAIFPGTVLKADSQAVGRWNTTSKGTFYAKGAGQSIVGRRGHIIICDDVVDEKTVDYDEINDWYMKGVRTRLLPNGAEVVINTRWHVNDLSGFLEKTDKGSPRPWEVIRIPAILTKEASGMLSRPGDVGEYYKPGTSFWPQFWPTETLLEKKAVTPPSVWNALYQQNPIAQEGSIIKRHEFKYWESDTPPRCKYLIVSMDTAFSKSESADYSTYQVWGVFGKEVVLFDNQTTQYLPCMVLLESDKGRWDFAELCQKAQAIEDFYRPDFFLVENKASGQSLIPELRKRGMPVVPYTPGKKMDKVTRLQSCTPYFQSGRIFVPKGKRYAEDLIDETVAFPKAEHDDQVDCLSQAVLWLRDCKKIDNNWYRNDSEEDEEFMRGRANQASTYWSSLFV